MTPCRYNLKIANVTNTSTLAAICGDCAQHGITRMRTETVTRSVGEYLGPVDWTYDFAAHYKSAGLSPERQDAELQNDITNLRALEANPNDYEATTDGGWPRFGWHSIISVGMYDGWPFWRPTPSVCLAGVLGCEWHPWYAITGISLRTPTPTQEARQYV